MGSQIQGNKEIMIWKGVEISQPFFAVLRLDDVRIDQVMVGATCWRGTDLLEGLCLVEVMLHEVVVVHRLQHFRCIDPV